jgi:hypothetical protein
MIIVAFINSWAKKCLSNFFISPSIKLVHWSFTNWKASAQSSLLTIERSLVTWHVLCNINKWWLKRNEVYSIWVCGSKYHTMCKMLHMLLAMFLKVWNCDWSYLCKVFKYMAYNSIIYNMREFKLQTNVFLREANLNKLCITFNMGNTQISPKIVS